MRVSFEAFFRSRKRLPVFGAAGTKVGVFLLYVQLLLILQVGFAYVLPSGSYETCLDVSTSVSEEQFACLVQETNVTQVIIRAWHSSGSMDENAKGTVNAASSLVRNVDVYMFPCPTCGDYQGQVETMLQGLEGAPYQKVWLDIEGQQFWYDDVQRNLQIFEELADVSSLVSIFSTLSLGIRDDALHYKAYDLFQNLPLAHNSSLLSLSPSLSLSLSLCVCGCVCLSSCGFVFLLCHRLSRAE